MIFNALQSGVSAYSTDKRVVISDVQYVEGTNVFIPRNERLLREFELLLGRVGIHRVPWKPVALTAASTPGLILSGRIAVDSPRFDLFPSRRDVGIVIYKVTTSTNSDLLFCPERLPNGTYHLRAIGETNDLAIIRVGL